MVNSLLQWSSFVNCYVGLSLGENEATQPRDLLSVCELRGAVTIHQQTLQEGISLATEHDAICYLCSDWCTEELVASLHVIQLLTVNTMVTEIWTRLLGYWGQLTCGNWTLRLIKYHFYHILFVNCESLIPAHSQRWQKLVSNFWMEDCQWICEHTLEPPHFWRIVSLNIALQPEGYMVLFW